MLSTYCFVRKKCIHFFFSKKKGGTVFVCGRASCSLNPDITELTPPVKNVDSVNISHCTCGRNTPCVLHPMNVTPEVHMKAGISPPWESPDLTSSPDAGQVRLNPRVDSPSALSTPSLRYTRGKGCSCFSFLIVITAPGRCKQEMLAVRALARVRSGTGKVGSAVGMGGALVHVQGLRQGSVSRWVQPAV